MHKDVKNKKKFEFAERLKLLPPYLFVEVDRMKKKAKDEGVDIINLGVGDPDIPTCSAIINEMVKSLEDPANHKYPMGKGKRSFREEIRSFLRVRYDVELDAEEEIQPLIGTKEGIAHLPLAFVEKGDTVLVPEPAYPVYNSGTLFAGGKPYFYSLKESNDFLPDWDNIPEDVLKSAKLMFINYPNNPTGAQADKEFFRKTIDLAKEYEIIIAQDAAYNEIFYGDENRPASILELEGAMDTAIEFHSLSKTFSMTGWRIGWACGNRDIIKGLAKVKNNIDSGVFGAVQDAAGRALINYDEISGSHRKTYGERVGVLYEGLKEAGWSLKKTGATFYVWARPPAEVSSADAVKKIISEAGIVCTPGSGFGASGEGYVRFAATRDTGRIREALERLKELKW